MKKRTNNVFPEEKIKMVAYQKHYYYYFNSMVMIISHELETPHTMILGELFTSPVIYRNSGNKSNKSNR